MKRSLSQLISVRSNWKSLTSDYKYQDEKDGEVPRVLQHYTADKLSSFGELALM